MTTKTILQQADAKLCGSGILVNFMNALQRNALRLALRGEEGEGIAEIVLNTVKRIETMPKTHETNGQGDDAIVHLHYFVRDVDIWLTEKDCEEEQLQAYGFVNLGDPEMAEVGYVSIKEITEAGAELDLYWEPKPLGEIIKAVRNDGRV